MLCNTASSSFRCVRIRSGEGISRALCARPASQPTGVGTCGVGARGVCGSAHRGRRARATAAVGHRARPPVPAHSGRQAGERPRPVGAGVALPVRCRCARPGSGSSAVGALAILVKGANEAPIGLKEPHKAREHEWLRAQRTGASQARAPSRNVGQWPDRRRRAVPWRSTRPRASPRRYFAQSVLACSSANG